MRATARTYRRAMTTPLARLPRLIAAPFLLCGALLLPLAASPGPALGAEGCESPSITVSATPTISTLPTTIDYTYGFCYDSDGNHYTVQIVDQTTGQAATPLQIEELDGKPGSIYSGGVFTPTTAGRYRVIVEYFQDGQSAFEDEGESSFIVSPEVTGSGGSNHSTGPGPSPGTGSTSGDSGSSSPGGSTPGTTGSGSKGSSTGKPSASSGTSATGTKLCITKTAKRRVIPQGGVEAWTVRVRDCGTVTATQVVVTDPLEAGVSIARLGDGKPADDAVSWDVGTLAPGQSHTFHLSTRFAINSPTGERGTTATAVASNAALVSARAKVRLVARPQPPHRAAVTG